MKIFKRTAALAALLTPVLTLTAWGGSSNGDIYQSRSDGGFLIINEDQINYVDPDCSEFAQVVADLDDGELDASAAYEVLTGTLSDSRDSIAWDDGDDDSIRIDGDIVEFALGAYENNTYVRYDSDVAVAEREEKLAGCAS